MSVPGGGGEPAAADSTIEAQGVATPEATTTGASTTDLGVAENLGAEASGGDDAPILSEAEQADEADLQSYPEAVRDDFKALPPEKRKALYEEAEKRAEARITANRERLDKLEAERMAQEARRADIRARTGKHVGAEAQKLTLPNGNEIELPSYDEMVKLSTTQRGRDQLAEKYGLDDYSTEFWRFIFDRNREALDASADLLDDSAWGKLDVSLRDGIKQFGFDPSTVLDGAQSPADVIKQFGNRLKTDHAAEIASLKKEHEARQTAADVNAEGMRGRVLAATSRGLATGGRSGGGAMTQAAEIRRLRQENPTEFAERAMRGDFAGVDLRDR